jgi:hypothetical protein
MQHVKFIGRGTSFLLVPEGGVMGVLADLREALSAKFPGEPQVYLHDREGGGVFVSGALRTKVLYLSFFAAPGEHLFALDVMSLLPVDRATVDVVLRKRLGAFHGQVYVFE